MNSFSSQSTLAPSEHQKEYVENQIIKFDIPSFYGYVDPRQSFLRMNIELTGTAKLQLSKHLGAQSLISAIRIYDHSNSQLLENLENYGELVKVLNRYGNNETLSNQQQLLEAQDKLDKNDRLELENALFFNQQGRGDTTATSLVTTKYLVNDNKVQVAMKLHSGILGGDKVFPINAFGGLRVEIELNRAEKAIMMADYGKGVLNDSGVMIVADTHAPTITLATGAGPKVALEISGNPDECPFVVGQKVYFINDADAEQSLTITEIKPTGDSATTTLTFASFSPGATAVGKKVYLKVADITGVGFKLSDVELCLKQVNPPQSYIDDMVKQMGSDEGLNLDIKTFDLVRNNIIAGQIVNEQPIRSFSQRVYSVLSLLTLNDSDTIGDDSFRSLTDKLQRYSYAIDGKKNPNRDVDVELTTRTLVVGTPSTYHINQQAAFELHKSLESCGLTIRNLPLKSDFLIGRAMGRYGGVYNIKDHNLTLRTQFDSTQKSANILCLNYLCSLRRLNVSNKGIMVIQ